MDELDYTKEQKGEKYYTPSQLDLAYYWYKYIRPGCLIILFLIVFAAIIAGLVWIGK